MRFARDNNFLNLIGTIPTGYAYEALQKSQEHKLPAPPKALGSNNFPMVYFDIINFCREARRSDPVYLFTMDTEIPMMASILQQLSNDEYRNHFELLSLNTLFYELVNNVGNEMQNKNVTNMLLKKDTFDYADNIACETHVEEEVELKCSLSIAHRWMFTTCATICEKLDIELKSGFHIPINTEDCATVKFEKFESKIVADVEDEDDDETETESVSTSASTTYSDFKKGSNNPFVSANQHMSSSTSFTSNNTNDFPPLDSRRKRNGDTRRRYFEN